MKRPSFSEGVAVALAAALLSALGQPALALLLGPGDGLRLLISLGSLAYLLYLTSRAARRDGRSLVPVEWLMTSLGSWAMLTSIPLFGLLHWGLAWATRAVYLHRRPLAALLDLGLAGLALLAGLGTWIHTGSLFLTVWTTFLAQALFVWLPGTRSARTESHTDDRFEQAHRRAETAVTKLTARAGSYIVTD